MAGSGQRVIGLPGNPVSFLCLRLSVPGAADSRFVRPRRHPSRRRESALLGRDLAANDQREDYLRARLEERPDGSLVATRVDKPGQLAASGISLRRRRC